MRTSSLVSTSTLLSVRGTKSAVLETIFMKPMKIFHLVAIKEAYDNPLYDERQTSSWEPTRFDYWKSGANDRGTVVQVLLSFVRNYKNLLCY